jgi:hypothetical protein
MATQMHELQSRCKKSVRAGTGRPAIFNFEGANRRFLMQFSQNSFTHFQHIFNVAVTHFKIFICKLFPSRSPKFLAAAELKKV